MFRGNCPVEFGLYPVTLLIYCPRSRIEARATAFPRPHVLDCAAKARLELLARICTVGLKLYLVDLLSTYYTIKFVTTQQQIVPMELKP